MQFNRLTAFSVENHTFLTPLKMVKTIDDMQQWDKSEAYFVSIILLLLECQLMKAKNVIMLQYKYKRNHSRSTWGLFMQLMIP